MRIERFESLGDNCEFGFVLGRHGVRGSNLLRWALTTIPVLQNALKTDFSDLYEFDNLEPSAKRMLRDRGTGIRFHSDMVREKKFVENHKEIYDQEVNKVTMLRDRLRQKLRDPQAIFVYKDNRNPPETKIRELAQTLADHSPANLLYVTAAGDDPIGSVVQKAPNLWFGRIDRLAEYSSANDLSAEVWSQILEQADRTIPVTSSNE